MHSNYYKTGSALQLVIQLKSVALKTFHEQWKQFILCTSQGYWEKIVKMTSCLLTWDMIRENTTVNNIELINIYFSD